MAAMQAILAAQRRKREEAARAAELATTEGGMTDYHATLVKLLVQNQGKLAQVFEAWDTDGTGVIDRKEFRSVLLMMGLKPTTDVRRTDAPPALWRHKPLRPRRLPPVDPLPVARAQDLEEFFKVADADNSGDISLEELVELMKEHEDAKQKGPPRSVGVRMLYAFYDFINTTGAQTVLYLIFVVIFQLLTDTLRCGAPNLRPTHPPSLGRGMPLGQPSLSSTRSGADAASNRGGCPARRSCRRLKGRLPPTRRALFAAPNRRIRGFAFRRAACAPCRRSVKEEFYLDKMISDTLIENHFDSSHNTFLSIRRHADIWEWGNTVLWPGLMGNGPPPPLPPSHPPPRFPSHRSPRNLPFQPPLAPSPVLPSGPFCTSCVEPPPLVLQLSSSLLSCPPPVRSAGPACGVVGLSGYFRSSYGVGATNLSFIKARRHPTRPTRLAQPCMRALLPGLLSLALPCSLRSPWHANSRARSQVCPPLPAAQRWEFRVQRRRVARW